MDSNINFLIVEDSYSFSLELKMTLEEIGYKVIGQAEDSAKALELIFSKKPDVILMDIDIKGDLSGTEVALHVKPLDIPIIFITSFDTQDHYNAAKSSNMYGYLIKPISKFTLESTIESTLRNWNAQKDESLRSQEDGFFLNNIFIKADALYNRIKISEIQCIEAEGKSTFLYINNERIPTKFSIKEMLEFLPPTKFIKTHRSYILNLEFIDSIDSALSQVTLKNGFKLLVSRQKRHELMNFINMK